MRKTIVTALFCLGMLVNVSAQQASNIKPGTLSKPEIDKIIQKFTANELAFREALTAYVFNRYATVNTIGMGGQISGTFRRDSFMTFTSDGQRFERILFAPVPTVHAGMVTVEDLEDLGGVNPFALEPRNVSQYNFTYLGKEKIDELNLHVFEVTPKVIPDPKSKIRLFTGRVWVDDEDLMLVKSKGKAVPETKKNKFPVVETWRENVDGKYWFPALALADDQLVFDDGSVLHIRMNVKYTDYKVGRTDVIVGDADDLTEEKPTPTPAPKKP
ncbi:MAG TPA: hypothetical protein VK612_01030 [Pyrinomonadaceae bacterium]|nr:hypothetical protein [Pyrinomonadaceae bacterium]